MIDIIEFNQIYQYSSLTKRGKLKISFHNISKDHLLFCEDISSNSKLIYSTLKTVSNRTKSHLVFTRNFSKQLKEYETSK